MKAAIEAYISIFIVSICVILCACIISADLNTAGARDAYATYASELQDSNFADDVVEACKNDAVSRGYSIVINIYDDGLGDRSGDIELKYNYQIAFLGFNAPRYIRGYIS